jgi:hypothetical protein
MVPIGEREIGYKQYEALLFVSIIPNLPKPKTVIAIPQNEPDLPKILILCHNADYTVRVDELCNGQIRYQCWHKPKTVLEPPNLVLEDGCIRQSPKKDKTEYVFSFGDWIYSVERIVSIGKFASTHIFLEVSDTENQRSTWKMEDLTPPKYLEFL